MHAGAGRSHLFRHRRHKRHTVVAGIAPSLRPFTCYEERRPTHSMPMRTVSSTAEQRCSHVDAGTQDTRAGGQERRERACGAAGGVDKSATEESRIDQPGSSASQSENLVPAFDPQQQQQGSPESSSMGSTFAIRGAKEEGSRGVSAWG